MPDFLVQLSVVGAVLASFLIGPVIAFAVLVWRKRQRRKSRRSPIGIDLLREPGHTVRQQLEEASNDLTFDLVLLAVMPMAFLCVYLGQERTVGVERATPMIPIFVIGGALFLVGLIRKMSSAGERLDRLRAGLDAEVAVGQALDQLMRQGAIVFHDLPAENFNIDHVVILDRGVFAVETKGYTKHGDRTGKAAATVVYDGMQLRFPSWTTKEPIEQAERQAKWLTKWLTRAIGEPVHVGAAVALPGWYVERSGRGDVLVFSGGELNHLPRVRCVQALNADQMQRIAHQVDQRCRTVAPTFGRASNATR